jgi:subtilisin family serine protease
MALKVASPDSQLSTSAIYSAIVYAADNGAKVINLSLGTSPGTPRSGVTTMEQAIAYAGTRGVTVVAASGNSGVDIGNQAVYPATFSPSSHPASSCGRPSPDRGAGCRARRWRPRPSPVPSPICSRRAR